MNKKDEDSWKTANRPPVCTSNPIEHLIPSEGKYETLRTVRQECIDHYGQDIISECNKRKVCLSKTCMGRELPWKSETALPYLKELTKGQKIENGLLFIKTDCSTCPIVKSCSSVCDQVANYINRDKTSEPQMTAKEYIEKVPVINVDTTNTSDFSATVPWDALSERRRKVIKMHLYDRRDFKYIAHKLGLNNQARAKYEYYAALTTISEYAIMREFLEESIEKLTSKQQEVLSLVYFDNHTLCEAAEHIKVSKQAVHQMISRVISKYSIKWKRFVWKRGNRVVYNVPKILR